jgi:gliding motility associated protien GldN
MKNTMLCRAVCLALAFVAVPFAVTYAQGTDPEVLENTAPEPAEPMDDFTARQIVTEKKVLKYAPVREADVLWETRIWRVIDTREKMNLPFVSPESALFNILKDGISQGQLTAYSTESDKFDIPLASADVQNMLSKVDTAYTINVETGEEEIKVVTNDINWEQVKRFRIKEAWFFDKNVGALRHRILGIAPMIDEVDEQGNFKFERPMFWVHYPSARPLLARHKAFSENVAAATTWEDLFEQRHFASYIYKESNVHDRRLSDYLAGVDLLMEGKRIQDELFNQEHDLWSW